MPCQEFKLHSINYTGTVHTCAKAYVLAVSRYGSGSGSVFRSGWIRIRIRIRDPDRHQNCLLPHCQPSLKISCKSIRKFCAKLLTDEQTTTITYPPWRR